MAHPILKVERRERPTESPPGKIWLVQAISLGRLFAGLLFASLAFQNVPRPFLAGIYALAMCSDLVDGFLARRLMLESYAGKIIDLVSDKSLTIVSLLYAAERGVSLAPLALIATREVVVTGLRAIVVDGHQILPTNRVFGGLMALALWGNTLFLVLVPQRSEWLPTINGVYWACAVIFITNLITRIYASRHRLMAELAKVE